MMLGGDGRRRLFFRPPEFPTTNEIGNLGLKFPTKTRSGIRLADFFPFSFFTTPVDYEKGQENGECGGGW